MCSVEDRHTQTIKTTKIAAEDRKIGKKKRNC